MKYEPIDLYMNQETIEVPAFIGYNEKEYINADLIILIVPVIGSKKGCHLISDIEWIATANTDRIVLSADESIGNQSIMSNVYLNTKTDSVGTGCYFILKDNFWFIFFG